MFALVHLVEFVLNRLVNHIKLEKVEDDLFVPDGLMVFEECWGDAFGNQRSIMADFVKDIAEQMHFLTLKNLVFLQLLEVF